MLAGLSLRALWFAADVLVSVGRIGNDRLLVMAHVRLWSEFEDAQFD